MPTVLKQRTTLLILLIALWITLSGPYSLKPIIFGGSILSLILVMVVVARMDRVVGVYSPRPELSNFFLNFPKYWWFLVGKVIGANLRVTRLVFNSNIKPHPRLIRMKVGPETALGKLVLSNSITLTPGTATLDLRAGEILVHALGSISADSVVNGDIDREVRRLEGQKGVNANLRPESTEGSIKEQEEVS